MPTFDKFQNCSFVACPFRALHRHDDTVAVVSTDDSSFTSTSFTTTSFYTGSTGNTLPAFREFDSDIDDTPYSHVMKKIVYAGTGKPTDEFGNELDTYVCLTCGFRMSFYGSASRTTLGIAP